MASFIELGSLDLRYQSHRLRDKAAEARLLDDIQLYGVRQPLEGVDIAEGRLLLNGFKRRRCASKLGLGHVPYVSLGEDQASGVMQLMRAAADKSLSILEQAKFVTDLIEQHGMTPGEIARSLSRSAGWVSMRRQLLKEISPQVQEILFAGEFPVYCYMYTLRAFMRMNGVGKAQVERFVLATADSGLSVRDLERLAKLYFQGPQSMREAIDRGDFTWPLEQFKNVPDDPAGCSEFERLLLIDMQQVQKYQQRVLAKCQDKRLVSRAFFAQANLLAGGLLSQLSSFQEGIQAFYDRSGNPPDDSSTA